MHPPHAALHHHGMHSQQRNRWHGLPPELLLSEPERTRTGQVLPVWAGVRPWPAATSGSNDFQLCHADLWNVTIAEWFDLSLVPNIYLTCSGYDDKPWLSSNYENCIYPYSPDCVTQYSLNQCCPVGTVCGDDRDSLARCNVSGSSYYEGEQVYLGFDSGKSCVCSRYYDDSREGVVSCVEQKCNFEVFDSYRLLNGGAPVYREESFCPYDWRLRKLVIWCISYDVIESSSICSSRQWCYCSGALSRRWLISAVCVRESYVNPRRFFDIADHVPGNIQVSLCHSAVGALHSWERYC